MRTPRAAPCRRRALSRVSHSGPASPRPSPRRAPKPLRSGLRAARGRRNPGRPLPVSFLISPKLWALSAAVLRRGHGGDGRRRSLCVSRVLLPGGSRGGRHGNGRAGGRRHGDGAVRGSVTPRARDSCAAWRVVAARRRQATGVLQRPCSPRDVGRAGDPSTTEAASSCAGGGRSAPCCARFPGNPGPARSEVRPLQALPQLCSPPACASKVRNVSPKPLRSYPRRGGKRPARGPRARAHPWAAGPAPCGTCVRVACPLPAPPPAATSPESLGGLLKLASPPLFCLRYALSK